MEWVGTSLEREDKAVCDFNLQMVNVNDLYVLIQPETVLKNALHRLVFMLNWKDVMFQDKCLKTFVLIVLSRILKICSLWYRECGCVLCTC